MGTSGYIARKKYCQKKEVEQYKARGIARFYSEIEGIDYNRNGVRETPCEDIITEGVREV